MKILDKKKTSWKFISKNKTVYDNIINEVNIMKKLDHPNVVKLIEVLDQADDDTIYIVMEYVGKYSVQKLYEKGTNQGQIWKYFRDTLKGLYYLHEVACVVHRDIKPENLLLTKDGTVKISDFG